MRSRNGILPGQHLFTFWAAIGAAVLLAACENPQPPGMCGAIPNQTVVVGDGATVSACFEDPNGDALSLYAASSDVGIATVSVSGSTLTVTAVSPGTAVVTVTATDVTQLSGDQQFRVLVPNRAPVATGEIASREIPAGESASVDVSTYFMEPDGQSLTYAMAISDESILGIAATGTVVTLEALAKGSATVTATATDPGGLSAVLSFLVTVPNRTPGAVGTIAPQIIEVDAAATLDVTGYFTDPDGDDLVYLAASSEPSVTDISISGGELTVTAIARGEATVTVTATDTEGLAATQEFVVTVPNRAPLATGSIEERTIEVDETSSLELSVYFSDPDGDVLVYSVAISDAAVAGVEVSGGALAVTAIAKGTATVTVTATDTDGLTATHAFGVTVPNRPPLVAGSIEGRTIEVGEAASIDLSSHFSDPDGDVLVYAAAASDAAVAGAGVEGEAMTVTAVAKGEATVTVTATDTEGLTVTQMFAVTVPNRPPQAMASIAERTLEVGRSAVLALPGYFEDPDGDALAYAVSSSDATLIGASVEGSDLTVTAVAKGDAAVTVTATDTEGLTATQEFVVTVPNRAPLATGSIEERTIEVDETSSLELSVYFGDPDGDVLVYSVAISDAAVAGVEVSGGALAVTAIAKGTATVTVTATDTDGLTATHAFGVTVPNRPPLVAGSIEGRTIEVGEAASIDLSSHFSDPDGDVLVYAAAASDAAVAGAGVEGEAMTVTAVAKGEATVTVTATDTEGLTVTQMFAVTVPNRPPQAMASIAERTLEVGRSAVLALPGYFEDPDGDALAYAVSSSDATLIGASVEGSDLTVTAVAKGDAAVTVTATDTEGLTATQTFAVTVANQPPVAMGSIEGQTIEVDETAAMDLSSYFTDPDGDDLAYSAAISDGAVAGVEVSGGMLTVAAIARGAATVTVTGTDTEGLTATQEFVVTVPNRPPLAAGTIEGRTIEVDETATLDLSNHFSEPDGDDLVYAAATSDAAVAGVAVEDAAMTVTAVVKGEATVTVTATDTEGLAATQMFTVTVPNRPPHATGPMEERTLDVGETAALDLSDHFSDLDGDALVYAATSSDIAVMGVEISDGALTVTALAKGNATVTITATDTDDESVTQEWVVSAANQAPLPVGSIEGSTIEVGETAILDMSGHFTDPDGDDISYQATSSDALVASVEVTGNSLSVAAIARGTTTVTVTATDTEGMTAVQEFTVSVPNRAPRAVGTVEPMELSEGGVTRIAPSPLFADPDGDALALSAESSRPQIARAWVASNGILVRGVKKGTATVTITAEDTEGLATTLRFNVRVKGSGGSDPNQPPVATGQILSQDLREGDERMVDASSFFSDPDNDVLEFSASSSNTEVVKATASGSEVELEVVAQGSATVTVTAEDPEGLGTSQDFGVTVAEAGTDNRAPAAVGTIADRTLEEDESTTLEASTYFNDPDGDALTFSATSHNLEVLTATTSGSGIELQATDPGTARVSITAVDPGGLDAQLFFDVTVVEPESPNRPPVVGTIPAQRVKVGNSRTLDASAHFNDPDGDDLTFSVESSDTEVVTANISGNDLELQAAAEGTATVTVTAEDPEGLSASADFQVTVTVEGNNNNQPPQLYSAPRSRTIVPNDYHWIHPWKHFEDPDNGWDDLRVTATSSDTDVIWIDIQPSGALKILTGSNTGEVTITITVTDPHGLSASVSVVLTAGNNPPRVDLQPEDLVRSPSESDSLPLRRWLWIDGMFEDDDVGEEMTFTVTSSDNAVAQATIAYNGLYGYFVRVTAVSIGEATVTATATDLGGLSTDASFVVTVNNNRPPRLKQEIPDPYETILPDTIVIPLSDYFEDPEGDSISYSARYIGSLSGYINADTVVIKRGFATLLVTAADPQGRTITVEFEVCVYEASQDTSSGSDDSGTPDEVKREESIPIPVGRPSTNRRATGPGRPPGGR